MADLGPLAKMPALERLLLPSGCLDLRSTAALRQQEALSGRAFWPESLDRPCDFVPQRTESSSAVAILCAKFAVKLAPAVVSQ